MLLILSSRMVNDDIALHYGQLPPSFLPLGNQRLFSLQAEQANGGPVAMTVPDDFEISETDRQNIEAAGIRLLPQSPKLSLTSAIKQAVETLKHEGPLRLLYGDTLVRPCSRSSQTDQMVVKETTSNYPWAFVVDNDDGTTSVSDDTPKSLTARRVVCGDFCFSDTKLLAEACETGNIIDALNYYHQRRPFELADTDDWFDFGHLPLYFQSKKSIMINREFNQLAYENDQLIKQSEDTAKMRAEANWYESMPGELRIHAPRFGGRVERDHLAGYAIEYLYHPLLSDLFSFGALPLASWLEILNACFDFADKCHAIAPDEGAPESAPAFSDRFFDSLIVNKTWGRLQKYLKSVGHSMDDEFSVNGTSFPSLTTVVEKLLDAIPKTQPTDIRYWHGDMFFGNMFYDFTARRVMVIDPRGQLDDGQQSKYGDWRYDIAKLAHSVIGRYDKIILGRAKLTETGDSAWELEFDGQAHQAQFEDIFIEQVTNRYGLNRNELSALTSILFFSMLPLHGDRPDLQKQLFANALRLAGEVEGVTA